MKIEYIREFVSLGKHLNFSKAATELFVSQSTISRHVADMEQELGQKLLRRDSHSVELTLAGQAALSTCQTILKQYDSLLEQLDRLRSGAHGDIILAQSSYAVDRYVNPVLFSFMQNYPDVKITALACEPHDAFQAVNDGQADLGLVVYYHEPYGSDLVFHEVAQEDCFFGMSKTHHLAQNKSLKLSDINGEKLILVRKDSSYTSYIEENLAANNVFPKERIYIEHVENYNATIQLNNAVALQPAHLMDAPHRGLIYLPIRDAEIKARVAFVHLASNKNPAIQLFLDEAKSIKYS